MRLQFENEIFFKPIAPRKIIFDPFVAPLGEQFAGVGAKRVQAGEVFRGRVVPLEEEAQVFGAPALLPPSAEPVRMGEGEGGLGCLQFLEQPAGFLAFAGIAAEEGVDEARLRAESELPGQRDGFMHSGVVGDAVEPEHLIEPQPQQDLQRFIVFEIRGDLVLYLIEGLELAGDFRLERDHVNGIRADDWLDRNRLLVR